MSQQYEIKNMCRSLTILFIALIVFGCKAASEQNFTARSSDSGIVVAPDQPKLGDVTSLELANPEAYRSVSWSLTYESGAPISQCQSNTSSLNCAIQEAGIIHVTVDVEDYQGRKSTLQTSFTVLDTGAGENQAPRIVADITDSLGHAVATFATDPNLDSGSMNVPVGTYTLNFSRTTDDQNSIGDILFEVNINGAGFHPVSKISSLVFSSASIYQIDLRATDKGPSGTNSDGKKSPVKTFVAYIKCLDSDTTPLSVSAANITVTPEAIKNFFTYKVSGVSGGTGNYVYYWDFNGDNVFDGPDWTALTSTTSYDLYGGNRKVGLKVWDKTCNLFAKTAKTVNLDIPHMDVSSGPAGLASADYYYLQGDVAAPTTGLPYLDQVQNVDFEANYYLHSPAEPKRVQCQYAKVWRENGLTLGNPDASLTVYGFNYYSQAAGARTHSLELRVTGIKDSSGIAALNSAVIDSSQAYIYYATYLTDGAKDQVDWREYDKNAACTLDLSVTPVRGADPCNVNSGSNYGVQIQGTYHCPDLKSADGQHIDVGAQYGAFYCQVQSVDACVGGGSQSPGTPPRGQ